MPMRKAPVELTAMQSGDTQEPERELPAPKGPRTVKTRERPLKELEAAFGLLRKHDDTSRFVGLALLKPVLEQELSQHDAAIDADGRGNVEIIQRSWNAIPANFLDRLLKARPKEGRSKDEAENMVGVAVAVLQAFMALLESPHTDEKFIDRVPILMSILHYSSPGTRDYIIEIIHGLAMIPEGRSAIFGPSNRDSNPDQVSSPYLLLAMIHADIISTLPYLQQSFPSQDYAATSTRLIKAYDIISAFIGYLTTDLPPDDDGGDFQLSLPMSADLLLKVQGKLIEIMYQTIEYLRERYDASAAGAAGPSASTRFSNGETLGSAPLIGMEAIGAVFDDPLTLSQLRAFSLWLADDDNWNLRKAATGIMDFLQAIYQHKGDEDDMASGTFQARLPVLKALSGIVRTTEGVEAFLRHDWWRTLTKDLRELISSPQLKSDQETACITIIRILTMIVDSRAACPAKEEWFPSIIDTNDQLMSSNGLQHRWELAVGACNLILCLFRSATVTTRDKYRPAAERLLKRGKDLLENDPSLRGEGDEQMRKDLEIFVNGLGALRDQWMLTGVE